MVIGVIAVLVGLLLPALAKARNTARQVASTMNMGQIARAQEAYRAERRDALPVPMNLAPNGNGATASGFMFGGKFCDSIWSGTPYDSWPGERPLNPFTNPSDVLPKPSDVLSTWVVGQPRPSPEPGMRENMKLDNWRSPGDRIARVTYALPVPPGMSQYEFSGTSYLANIYWIEMASERINGDPYSVPGWKKAIRWGTKMYDRNDTSKFVIAFDPTAAGIRSASPVAGTWPVIKGEFGGNNHSVLGFADGHAGYFEMVRKPSGTFPYAQNAMGSLAYPGFAYSFQMDNPPPQP